MQPGMSAVSPAGAAMAPLRWTIRLLPLRVASPVHVQLSDGYRRDPRWRPLRPEELVAASTPRTGKDYFFSAVLETPEYYWLIRAASPQGT